jgi:Protein of unknown function (DUF3365)
VKQKMRWFVRSCCGLGLAAALSACGTDQSKAAAATAEQAPAPAGIAPEKVADMLHAVLEADRTVYTKQVVNRLVKEQALKVVDPETKQPVDFAASEQWKTEHGKLPLPAQMFRMGSEAVAKKGVGMTYSLLSQWPVNKQNTPKTEVEIAGLAAVLKKEGEKPHYGTEVLGGQKYFTAVYADVAVASACVDCHNDHKDSPRRDFEVGDVMGGVVIRLPL